MAEVATAIPRADIIFFISFMYKFLFILHAGIQCFSGTPALSRVSCLFALFLKNCGVYFC